MVPRKTTTCVVRPEKRIVPQSREAVAVAAGTASDSATVPRTRAWRRVCGASMLTSIDQRAAGMTSLEAWILREALSLLRRLADS